MDKDVINKNTKNTVNKNRGTSTSKRTVVIIPTASKRMPFTTVEIDGALDLSRRWPTQNE